MPLQAYDASKSYRWNYDRAPAPEDQAAILTGNSVGECKWRFCGLPVPSPLGIAAGPLLNGNWLLHYARLGFDILTYKTVRSQERECYPLPNLQPIRQTTVEPGQIVDGVESPRKSWAISFGMPSMQPKVWMQDIAWARERLPREKILSVSVVATASPDWTIQQVAEDYAKCAEWAAQSGADVIELNFSCPNVSSIDGQLYQDLSAARRVLNMVRETVPSKPLVVKIGHVDSPEQARDFVRATDGLVAAISMTNCLACRVRSGQTYLFNGEARGIGGDAIRSASVAQVGMFAEQIAKAGSKTVLIGVGGISEATHVTQYLDAGAESVQLATAPMLDPEVGLRIQQQLVG